MITFSNPYVIDIRGVTTFGVNAKDETKNAIGRFGTGIKYGIATLIRNGCEVVIYAGTATYTFQVRQDTVRGKEFEFIDMHVDANDGHPHIIQLAFTTALGRDWKMWQAYRELYCNSVTDEGGTVEKIHDDTPLGVSPDWTVITVKGEAFENEHDRRHEFLLDPARIPLFVVPNVVEVYRGTSISVFYRGVCVGDVPEGGARYTYNVLGYMSLTEDRTMLFESQFADAVKTAVLSGINEEYTRDVLMTTTEDGSDRKGFEPTLDFTGKSLASHLIQMAKELIEKTKERVNRTFRGIYTDYEREHLISRRVQPTEDEAILLKRIVDRMRLAGFPYGGLLEVAADLGAGNDIASNNKTILVALETLKSSNEEDLRFLIGLEIIKLHLHQSESNDTTTRVIFDKLLDRVNTEVWERTHPTADDVPEPPAAEPLEPVEEFSSSEPEQTTIPHVYVLTGTWSRNNKMVHREILEQDDDRVEKLKALHYIGYTDSTTLSLDIKLVPKADTIGLTVVLGYDELIRQAIRDKPGVNFVNVADLR